MRRFTIAVLAFFILALLAPMAAFASDQPATKPASQCGATVADALKQARLSLRNKDAGSERVVLACLIEAVDRLDAQTPTATRADGNRVLTVPSFGGASK